jgi:hypothetical protein
VSAASPIGPEPPSDAAGPAFTWLSDIGGVAVVGFVDRSRSAAGPEASYDRDIAEFGGRMEGLLASGSRVAVVDFSCYRFTDGDNGRAVVGSLLAAHRGLSGRSGGLLVCHHPVQLNPDLQGAFRLDRVIGIYRSRGDAIAAARSLGCGAPPAAARTTAPGTADGGA